MKTDTGTVIRLADYRPPSHLVETTEMVFRLDPTATRVTTRYRMRPNPAHGAPATLRLDGDGLVLAAVTLDGETLGENRVTATPDALEITSLPDGPFELEIETVINPDANKALSGLYRSNGIYCTQCEAEGFRRITYALDRPDVLSVYTVRVEADPAVGHLLLSNGNPVGAGVTKDGKAFAVWHDPHPKPSYLFALVAGDLDTFSDSFTTSEGRTVALNIHVEKGKAPMAAYAMDALKRSMAWDEEVFGLPYDLDVFNIVAVSDFNMGAMENKGLNVFNDKYVLADPDTATDADYANIEAIIAHEYFHNWTGNRITCRDWFQLCLKEGLTVFRDHEFSADMRSRPVKRIAEIRLLMAQQYPEDAGPLAHPVRPEAYREINNFYTATVYEKGSEVVRMLRTILGADLFREGLRLYLSRHDGDAATVEQFIACFAEVSGRDLGQFFLWYRQAGTPQISFETRHDAANQRFTLTVEQAMPTVAGQANAKPMHVPCTFGLVGPDGNDLAWQSVTGAEIDGDVIHLRQPRHEIVFDGIAEAPVVSLFRGLSAPVKVVTARANDELAFLAARDADPVSRWQALNALLLAELGRMARVIQDGGETECVPAIPGIMAGIAADDMLEDAFRALCLAIPNEMEIARELGDNIDPDAISAARQGVQRAIANAVLANGAPMAAGAQDAPFSPDAASAGRRALANALAELAALAAGMPDGLAHRYGVADNMTDRLAALGALTAHFSDDPATVAALAAFRSRYANDPLALDKWFSINAGIGGAGAVERVRALMADPAYKADNPNRVRALIGAFATLNPTGFHRRDGEGYRLFIDVLIETDRFNPQLAARLATTLRSWRSVEPVRRAHLRNELSRLAAMPAPSRDIADIVQRILA